MKPGYLIAEGFSGFRRTTLSSMVSITIICIALSLLGFFLIVTFNITNLIGDIRSRVELEAFLDKALDSENSQHIGSVIRDLDGVDSVYFISKAEAARILKSVMGEDDLFDLVETNPLPASFKIRLEEPYRTLQGVEEVAQAIENIRGVEEVNYQKELLRALDERIDVYNNINLAVGALAAIAAIFLVSNTIKLSIYSKRDLIKSMKLVGATNAFIASPFLLEGVLQGLIGSGLACGAAYGMVYGARKFLLPGVMMDPLIYAILVGMGILLGLTGSFISIRFFLKEKISDM
ncbi:ABC transporter permease [bacterium]|nr:ABC transporter permease [bacterium]